MTRNLFVKLLGYSDFRAPITFEAAALSRFMMDMIEDEEEDIIEFDFYLDTIDPSTMTLVLDFLHHHSQHQPTVVKHQGKQLQGNVSQWDLDFIDLDLEMIVNLLLAADFMDCPLLMDLALVKLALMIKRAKLETIYETFRVEESQINEANRARENNIWMIELFGTFMSKIRAL